MSNKLTFGVTGPSLYSDKVQLLIENYFNGRQLFINSNSKDDLEWHLNQCQAVILAGGRDLHITTYGGEMTNGDSLNHFSIERDRREQFIISYCLKNKLPLLTICRGFQLIGTMLFGGEHFIKNINACEVVHNCLTAKIDNEDMSHAVHYLYILQSYQKEFIDKSYVGSGHHQALWFSEKQLEYYRRSGAEILGYAHLNYNADPKKEQKIIEFMRGIDSPWYGTQFHVEDGWEKSKFYQTILEKFQTLLPNL